MISLWGKDVEKLFFESSLNNYSTPEQLFYIDSKDNYFAYWPKTYKGKKTTLQSRNSLIGNYTEKWVTDLIHQVVKDKNLYSIQGAVCEEVGLNKKSSGDCVISRKKSLELKPEDILMIFEVKMSIVWNWQLINNTLKCIGDYNTHTGNPSILRSDSMLKAIGKGINIRVSGNASKIPIVILGNTLITNTYHNKVDHLKSAGIIQGFWSLNPNPLEDSKTITHTTNSGFMKMNSFSDLKTNIDNLLAQDLNFFSSMKNKKELGKIIEVANKKGSYEEKAEEFLRLIEGDYE